MVDVRDRRHRDAVEAEPLELEAGHRPRRVLEQDLVDPELDLLLALAGEVAAMIFSVSVRADTSGA